MHPGGVAQRTGLTLLEVVLAIAIMSSVLAAALLSRYQVDLAPVARSLTRELVLHRANAVLEGGGSRCLSGGEHSSYVVAWPPRGLLFTPDGLPRTCDGGGVGNTTILLEHRGRQAAVIVSSLGRVRWELR